MALGDQEAAGMRDKPRIALFSPLPPVASGISDYTADLLPFLSQRLDMELWVDQPYVQCVEAAPFPLRRWSSRAWRLQQENYDLAIYQMGNSPVHRYMLEAMAIRPGLVVLHDFVMHHLMFWKAVVTGTTALYRSEMRARYGELGERVAQEMLLGRSPLEAFECPLSEDIVGGSLAVGAHSRYVIDKIGPMAGTKPARFIPMGVPIARPANKVLARRCLGLPETGILALSLGHLNPYKGIELVLRVTCRLALSRPGLKLVIVGSVSPHFPLARILEAYDADGSVVYLGRVSPDRLPLLLSAADFSFSLRYPTAGETSASLLRSLSYGLPGIVTDAGAFSELPDSCCPKVPVGPEAEDLLEAYVCALIERSDLLAVASLEAQRYVRCYHTLVHSSNAYFQLIGELLGTTIEPLDWQEPDREAKLELPLASSVPAEIPAAVAEVLDDLSGVTVGLGWGNTPGPAISVLVETLSDFLQAPSGKDV
jgi:glycosyltransferase involved in cell wall biosynthesis